MKPKPSRFVTPLLLAALLATVSVHGAKVYKWVDEDGRVTYRDQPPPAESGGKVQEKELDSDSNVIEYEAPPAPEPPKGQSDQGNGDMDQSNSDTDQESSTPPPGVTEDEAQRNILRGGAILEERRRMEQQRQQPGTP